MIVRCPFCVHDFEVAVPEPEKPKEDALQAITAFTFLQTENESLRWENQRLSIINHYHRGDNT
jgi:hypothetical protein